MKNKPTVLEILYITFMLFSAMGMMSFAVNTPTMKFILFGWMALVFTGSAVLAIVKHFKDDQ